MRADDASPPEASYALPHRAGRPLARHSGSARWERGHALSRSHLSLRPARGHAATGRVDRPSPPAAFASESGCKGGCLTASPCRQRSRPKPASETVGIRTYRHRLASSPAGLRQRFSCWAGSSRYPAGRVVNDRHFETEGARQRSSAGGYSASVAESRPGVEQNSLHNDCSIPFWAAPSLRVMTSRTRAKSGCGHGRHCSSIAAIRPSFTESE